MRAGAPERVGVEDVLCVTAAGVHLEPDDGGAGSFEVLLWVAHHSESSAALQALFSRSPLAAAALAALAFA
ncbi:MAG: hypothetical protein ACRCYQ_14050 [Nocardioides sp.]